MTDIDGYRNLLKFVRREGHTAIKPYHIEGSFALGRWVSKCRAQYRKGTLGKDLVKILESLPQWHWDLKESQWFRYYDFLREYVSREGHGDVPKKHAEKGINLGNWVCMQRFKKDTLSTVQINALENIDKWSWHVLESRWEKSFSALCAFAIREGHFEPSADHLENGINLSNWIYTQRSKKAKLSLERIRALEALPNWKWELRKNPRPKIPWEQAYDVLRRYVEKNGTSRVPAKYIDEDGFKLGVWVGTQRQKKSHLSKDRIEALEKLPEWGWQLYQDAWDEKFEVLRRYVEREGHAAVPGSHVEEDIELGRWVRKQRSRKRELSREQLKRLEQQPDWTWNVIQSAWERAYNALCSFVKREGHARVPQSHVEEGINLGHWVSHQRVIRRKLSKEYTGALERLPGWAWEPQKVNWEHGYSFLRKFAKQNGHTEIPYKLVFEGFKLGAWVARQRAQRKAISKERIEALEKIPGWIWKAKSGPKKNTHKANFVKKTEKNFADLLYDRLAEISIRDFEGYEKTRSLPALKIPGEFVFFLEELLETADTTQSEILADVIDMGITAWYQNLDERSKRQLNLPISEQGKTQKEIEEIGTLQNQLSETKQQKEYLEKQVLALLENIEERESTQAQEHQNGYVRRETETEGYAPLTSHKIEKKRSYTRYHPKRKKYITAPTQK